MRPTPFASVIVIIIVEGRIQGRVEGALLADIKASIVDH